MVRSLRAESSSPTVVSPVLADSVPIVRWLRQSTLFRDYQQAFEAATGFPLVLRAAGAFEVPLAGSAQTNPFCALMTATNKTCSACLLFQQRTEEAAVTEAQTMECPAGLIESVVPVRVGDRVLGYLQTGQVLLAPPSARQLAEVTRLPVEPGAKGRAVHAKLAAAFAQTRVVEPEQYAAIIRLLVIFAEHLAVVSNQLLTSVNTSESPCVSKIRAFIAERLEEALALEDVARVVSMSPWYFCKFFKRATGFTFTEYLARARVEAVKTNLQNVHARVSEAAFAAGFQSLSQFNRVFRRVSGETPTGYRSRLHRLEAKPGRGRVTTRRQADAVG